MPRVSRDPEAEAKLLAAAAKDPATSWATEEDARWALKLTGRDSKLEYAAARKLLSLGSQGLCDAIGTMSPIVDQWTLHWSQSCNSLFYARGGKATVLLKGTDCPFGWARGAKFCCLRDPSRHYDSLPAEAQIQMDLEASHSVTEMNLAETTSQMVLETLGLRSQQQTPPVFITDATASVGGNTVNFAKHFAHVYSVEVDATRARFLRNNVKLLCQKNNVDVHCQDYTDVRCYRSLKQRVVFFDPPWGGEGYSDEHSVDLFLSGKRLVDVCCQLQGHTQFIVLKVPYNFDFNSFLREGRGVLTLLKQQPIGRGRDGRPKFVLMILRVRRITDEETEQEHTAAPGTTDAARTATSRAAQPPAPPQQEERDASVPGAAAGGRGGDRGRGNSATQPLQEISNTPHSDPAGWSPMKDKPEDITQYAPVPAAAVSFLKRTETTAVRAPTIGYYISVGGGSKGITDSGALTLLDSGGTKMLFGCEATRLWGHLRNHCEFYVAYQPAEGVKHADEAGLLPPQTSAADEGGRVKGLYKALSDMEVMYQKNCVEIPGPSVAEIRRLKSKEALSKLQAIGDGETIHCVVSFDVKKITTASGDGVAFGTTDSFDFKCGKGNPSKDWTQTPGSLYNFPAAPPNWKQIVEANGVNCKCGKNGAGMSVFFRSSIGTIPRWNWRYHQICDVIQRLDDCGVCGSEAADEESDSESDSECEYSSDEDDSVCRQAFVNLMCNVENFINTHVVANAQTVPFGELGGIADVACGQDFAFECMGGHLDHWRNYHLKKSQMVRAHNELSALIVSTMAQERSADADIVALWDKIEDRLQVSDNLCSNSELGDMGNQFPLRLLYASPQACGPGANYCGCGGGCKCKHCGEPLPKEEDREYQRDHCLHELSDPFFCEEREFPECCEK